MKQHKHSVAGEPVVINVVETEEDLEGFRDFIRSNLRCLGLDSEDDWYVEDGLLYVHAVDSTSVYNLDFVRVFDVIR